MPVASGRANGGAESPTVGISMRQSVAGVSIDEELATPQDDGGVGQIADVRKPARPAGEQGLVIQAVGEAVRS